jgi:trk system potassium uptake protein TrkH
MIIILIASLFFINIKPKNTRIYPREGFAIVAIGWLVVSLFGSLPFYLSGAIPSFIDCFFETVSGFTTTGSTILTNVEALPRGLLFWRSFTHWMGGMGVLVLTLAILPSAGAGALQIMNAETPGPSPGKIVPKVGQTAKILYGIYFAITVIQVIMLVLAGMPLFDSLIHTFGSVSTGGFSSKNASIAAYNSVLIETIVIFFMLMCGVNFSLYYQALRGRIRTVFNNSEFRFYISMVLISGLLITFNLYGSIYKTIAESLRHSFFQVASIITTTGYSSANFDKWPMFSKIILVILMFAGGCGGSTAGAIKQIRIIILLKIVKRELLRIIYPRAVYSVSIAGESIEEKTLMEVLAFFFLYFLIFIIAVLVVSIDGKSFATTITSVAATIGNIGPGLDAVGPIGSFADLSARSKVVLSLCMIIGRLEIYPILLMLVPQFWKKVNI